MAKEKLAKIWESTTKVMSTAGGTITVKAGEKGRERGKRRQRKRTRKRRETSCKFQFPRLLQNMWKMGDTRRVSVGKDMCKLWKKFQVLLRVQLHQSAATTPAAAKTAASIQELNVEQEPGWIFGVMGGISGISHNWYRPSVG